MRFSVLEHHLCSLFSTAMGIGAERDRKGGNLRGRLVLIALRLMAHSTGWLVLLHALFTIPQADPNL